MSAETVRIQLEPLSVSIEVPRGALLQSALSEHGIEFPCGGTAQCGGCGVRLLSGSLSITDQDRSVFRDVELAGGWRLACQAYAKTPLVLECGQWRMDILADNVTLAGAGKPGLGIAIDLGTTTIAAQMIDRATGSVLAVETDLNPQASFGSDVMSRVRAALTGANLAAVIHIALRRMIVNLAAGREREVAEVVLVGNTVMHHLFAGLDVEPLSHAPFHPPHLGEQEFSPQDLDWPLPSSCRIRFLRCLGGFVGSDILAGIHAVSMPAADDLMALIDLGTNGEIVIGNRHGMVCASTAAGPAFEAGSIRMGMRAVTGAISRVLFENGQMRAMVIGDGEPRGICGSGLVDAVAAGLESGAILPSGRIADGSKIFPVQAPVVLYQSDIRELQLAKSAIASGFRLLLKHLGATAADVHGLYLAGAFGNYVQIDSAIAVGMLELPRERIHAAGNTALRGAKMLLLSTSEPAVPAIEHVSLASDAEFQDEFVNCMTFTGAANYV
ncbi:MAG: ASKHA domain-containing protein [Terracidiphilus sp.]|jgi:uncharacterized 2Fe-2S/4Fe-4S cluster protein (DUF4445 family)